MADSIKDMITRATALVGSLRNEIEEMKKDGTITPDEATRIANNEKQIGITETKLKEWKRQFEADKAEWEGLKGSVDGLDTKIKTLTEWGTIDIKALASEADAAKQFGKDENYRGAIDRFKEVNSSMEKPYAEYEKQFQAKGSYETQLNDLETRLDTVKASKFQTAAVTQGVATIEGNLPTAAALADKKDYVGAVRELEPAAGEIDLIEKAVQKAAEEDAKVREELIPVQDKAAEVAKIEFPELKERISAAATLEGGIGGKIDSFDFNGARADIGTLSLELDSIKQEAAKIEAAKKAEEEKKRKEKEEWERQEPRFEKLKGQVGELEEFGSPEAAALRESVSGIDALVQAEDYIGATDTLPKVEADLKAPYDTFLKQKEAKKTYDAARPDIDKRAEAAHGNPNAGGVIASSMSELDAGLTEMNTKADAKDYIEACKGLMPATAKLDQIERDLRDLDMAAKVAEEMGLEQSSPEVQQEIKRRVYLEEQPIAQGRLDKIIEADAVGGEAAAQLDQATTEMKTAASSFDAGSYPEAVASVRTVIDSLPAIEELVRKQIEQKNLYEAARDAAKSDLGTLAGSAYKAITGKTETLQTGFDEAEELAGTKDYTGAIAKLELVKTGIVEVRAEEAAIIKDHAAADAALTTIQKRLDEALAMDAGELTPLQGGLTSKKNDVDAAYEAEDYKKALETLETLTKDLEEFEKKADTIKQKALYESALETLTIDTRVQEMSGAGYPEADAEASDVIAADGERKTLAESEDYEGARKKAFDEGTSLDTYEAKRDEIELAKDRFEANEPALQKEIDDALAAPVEPEVANDEIVAAQEELKGMREKLAEEVANKRFIAAEKLGEEAMIKCGDVKKLKDESIKIDEAKTDKTIDDNAREVAQAFANGGMHAVTNFRIDITRMITEERDYQKIARWGGYVLSLTSAAASVFPGGAMVSAVTGMISNAIVMTATEADDADDNRDKAIEAQLVGGLTKQASEIFDAMSKNYSAELKGKYRAIYDDIGRLVTRKKDSEARAKMKASGVPCDVNPITVCEEFLKQLKEKMKQVRG